MKAEWKPRNKITAFSQNKTKEGKAKVDVRCLLVCRIVDEVVMHPKGSGVCLMGDHHST